MRETSSANAAIAESMRWSQNGKQFRKMAGTRSWAGAEEKKRELEDQLAGRDPKPKHEGILLSEAIKTFEDNNKAQGINLRRELG